MGRSRHSTAGSRFRIACYPDRMHDWLAFAFRPDVVRRALICAVIVGVILIAINHSDAIIHGNLTLDRLARMGLTVIVPYVVSTVSSVGALRQRR